MLKTVYSYIKDPETIEFINNYFRKTKGARHTHFTSLKALRKSLRDSPPDVLITGVPVCIERIGIKGAGFRILGMMTRQSPEAMSAIVEHGVDQYISRPYQEYDLALCLDMLWRKSMYMDVLSQQKSDLETIVSISNMLSSTLDPQEVLYLIVKRISEIIPVSRCSIISVNHDDRSTAYVLSTFEDRQIHNMKLDLKKYPEIDEALREGKPVIVKDASADPLLKRVKAEIDVLDIKSIMVIPIYFRSEVIGTLFLRTSRRNHVFSEREIKLCQDIANTAANALNNAYLYQDMSSQRAELEKLAITDYLTGLYNVRYMYHRLESEFIESTRYKYPLSCLMMDLDRFKLVNDTYGHRVGDMVLREFSSLVKDHTRKTDVFSRYGGEEFVLLLPHTGMEGAIRESERILDVVRKHSFKGLSRERKLTLSIGISYCPHNRIRNYEDLIGRADKALLQAKANGRNKHVVAG